MKILGLVRAWISPSEKASQTVLDPNEANRVPVRQTQPVVQLLDVLRCQARLEENR